MKAKQQSPAATETWIHNVPEQKMKFTSEYTLSALKAEGNTSFPRPQSSDGNV